MVNAMTATFQQLRIVNFGRSKLNATGSTGVGYQLINYEGNVTAARTISGVHQTAPGIYAAYITFPDEFRGQILWDTGTTFSETYYASEQHNTEENLPDTIYDKLATIENTILTGSLNNKLDLILNRIDDTFQMTAGRWKIENYQMIFYKEDNLTEICRFGLFDENGDPSMDAVFDRRRVI
jgi:hypothetical protein